MNLILHVFLAALLVASPAFAGEPKYQVSIGVVTDWQTVQAFGGPTATQLALQQRIDAASRVFEEQVSLKLVPTVWVMPNSPAEDFAHPDTQPNVLLNYLVLWREQGPQAALQCQQGMTILMTTRQLTDSVYGIANVNSACWGQAAGIVEVNAGQASEDWQIFAHEVGHILGADHDGDPAGSCPSELQGQYLMTPESYRNATQEFSPCSVQVITAEFGEHVCVTAIPAAPPTSTPTAVPTPAPSHSGGGAFDWPTVLALVVLLAVRWITARLIAEHKCGRKLSSLWRSRRGLRV